jgi:Putative peptidoglycan binding domain
MKLQFLLAGIVAIGLFASAPDAVAHGGFGGGGGGGHGGGFHGGGRFGGFHGGRFGDFHGHRRFFDHDRFFVSGFGFYGYPWWWDWGYPYYSGYPYYPYYYPGYPGSYYGYDAYYGDPYYRTGDARSSHTKAVQAELARRGYYRGPINGVLGPESRSAIRSFQARNGLPVTGRIDGDLFRALRS